jgi:hypothetical protein
MLRKAGRGDKAVRNVAVFSLYEISVGLAS